MRFIAEDEPQAAALQLSPMQLELALLSVRRFIEDQVQIRRFSVRDRLELEELEGVLAEVVEG